MKKLFLSVFVIAALTSCGPSTVINKSWRDPATTVEMTTLNKVLVVAFMSDEASRRVVEEALVKRLNGKGVASYSYVSKTDDEKAVKAKLNADGFNGAIVMRLIDVEKETNYVPGTSTFPPYYGGFSPYYWNGYNSFNQPGYYTQDKIYNVETNVYSLKQDKLIWTGVTNTTNPGKTDAMTNEIADVVGKKMREEGFIK